MPTPHYLPCWPRCLTVPFAGQNSHWMRSFQIQSNEAWSKTGSFQVPSPCSEKISSSKPSYPLHLEEPFPTIWQQTFHTSGTFHLPTNLNLCDYFFGPDIPTGMGFSQLPNLSSRGSQPLQLLRKGWLRICHSFQCEKQNNNKKKTGFESVDKTSNIVNANGEGGHVLKTVFQILS